jgi:hypothetical protein
MSPAPMGSAPMGDGGSGGESDVERLEHEAAQTRDDLAKTLDALTHRLDVPARAREGLSDLGAKAGPVQPYLPSIALGAVAVVSVALGVRSRRR